MGWRDQIGKEFKYGVNVNMAYNKNEVTEVNNANHFIEGGNDLLAQSTGRFVRMEKDILLAIFMVIRRMVSFRTRMTCRHILTRIVKEMRQTLSKVQVLNRVI